MLHVHFGAGRLGLGLIVPFFQTGHSESFILNRAVSGTNPTGCTMLAPGRRNELLGGPGRFYVIQGAGARNGQRQVVRYDGFLEYGDDDVGSAVRALVEGSDRRREGIVVTASLLSACNYRPVLRALEVMSEMRARDAVGPVFLVACENTVSAHDVLRDRDLCDLISDGMRRHVTCVHGLVDRVCVELEEGSEGSQPCVVVDAEDYGSVKLELNAQTEALAVMLRGSRVEFTPHVAVEKQIKNWLLNGSHWLLALPAFHESRGNVHVRLNDFLRERPERLRFARQVMDEMSVGIAAILRREPEYAAFVRDVDVDDYLRGAVDAILRRFLDNEDPFGRILARFQTPTPDAPASLQAFCKRFADRVDGPMAAFEEQKGFAPPAATHSVQSLLRLIASGTYVNAA